ncbi:hypothetical protein AMECASPLE_016438 [Ameca splendens]|uniref:Secreted protein n=1 Tax=Ameca splendens TaxID=208324 RepID=A0ABV0Z0I0_9TELE
MLVLHHVALLLVFMPITLVKSQRNTVMIPPFDGQLLLPINLRRVVKLKCFSSSKKIMSGKDNLGKYKMQNVIQTILALCEKHCHHIFNLILLAKNRNKVYQVGQF